MRARLVLAMLLTAAPSVHAGDAVTCEGGRITVTGADRDLSSRVCRVAEAALDDLAACNVRVRDPLTISLVNALPKDCVGLYHCGEDLIQLRAPGDLSALRDREGPFSVIPAETYFDSLIVHELTHAAFDAAPCASGDCAATAEYLAYAMQVRSLPPERIAEFEAASDVDGPVAASAINVFILQMEPHHFAAKAWAHFSAQPDPCATAGRIMDGSLRFTVVDP